MALWDETTARLKEREQASGQCAFHAMEFGRYIGLMMGDHLDGPHPGDYQYLASHFDGINRECSFSLDPDSLNRLRDILKDGLQKDVSKESAPEANETFTHIMRRLSNWQGHNKG